jgi:putative transposase
MSSGIINKYTGYHNRRSIRLPGYDYSQPGYYFITICIHNRAQRLFGNVVDGEMVLNELGTIAYNQFECLTERFHNTKSDAFQIMPNHVRAIIPIHAVPVHVTPVGATLAVAPFPVNTVAPENNAVALFPVNTVAQQNPTVRNIVKTYRAGASPAPTGNMEKTGNTKNITIGDIIGAYKSLVSNECLKIYKSKNERMGKLWQRNYYDHIIRDEKSLFFIRKYVRDNPVNWENDSENHIDREIQEFGMTEIREKEGKPA